METLFTLRIDTDRQFGDLLDELLAGVDEEIAVWSDEEQDRARLERFCTTRREAEDLLARFTPLLDAQAGGHPWKATIDAVPSADWSEAWKAFFHTSRVSPRIVVKPSWEPFAASPGDCVVEIDPGMSFGTGQHGTTQACLVFLDDLAARRPGGSMLDLGCGSGILAIAAVKLGFHPVAALDHDPDAVRIARENAVHNGVAGQIEFLAADLTDFAPAATFDVVAANLLAPLLIAHADRIAGLVAATDAAALVLSGILDSQYAGVREAYRRRGFSEQRSLAIAEWKSAWFTRGGDTP